MPDWSRSMTQTFEYYIVDPATWKDSKRIDTVISCTIDRDSTTDTLGSATIDATDVLGEVYIRAYLVTIQDGIKETHPIGTFLVQTPQTEYDGSMTKITIDAYSPLLELKENPPPIGYSLLKSTNIMSVASQIADENMRAPVVPAKSTETLFSDFVSDTQDTWLSFIRDLVTNGKHDLVLDEMGRLLFSPHQEFEGITPIWTYTDDNSSILHPSIKLENDLYGIPNVVEVLYSTTAEQHYFARVVNDDPSSPTSTVNRGREIVYRVTDASKIGSPVRDVEGSVDYAPIQEYATQLLKQLSSIQCEITYTHAYCPIRIGDCVMINSSLANLKNIKAKVIKQSIKCEPGAPVTETAVFTKKLWR